MDTEVIEQSGAGAEPVVGTEGASEGPETTIDEVDHLLDAVEAALTRLDDGTYGACSSCGSVIEDARLSADPTARMCAACDADASEDRQTDIAIDSMVYAVDRAVDVDTEDRSHTDEPVYAVDRAADVDTEDRSHVDEPVYAVDRAADVDTEDRADDEDGDDTVHTSDDGQPVADADLAPWSVGRPPEG